MTDDRVGGHRAGNGDPETTALARFLLPPRVAPQLDPGFRPLALAHAAVQAELQASGRARDVWLAVEQPGGSVMERHLLIHKPDDPDLPVGRLLCERLLKLLLWSHGGDRIYVDGPPGLAEHLARHYRDTPTGRFDARLMGEEIYGRAFEVAARPHAEFPASREPATTLGGHRGGCRIGFDLGASDRKVAALRDGEVVFSEEQRWDPVRQADPQWHYDQIDDSLRRAAAHLPRVDAIGGSAAGVYVDGEARVASLFRAVPRQAFEARVRGLFRELAAAWGGVPFVVVNDGEVTALAGAQMAGVTTLLGLALGSSLAAGYVTPQGALTTRLDELAFAPLDVAPQAAVDEWSGDRGCGAQYLSQQALARLLPAAGIALPAGLPLPDRLVELQELMLAGDPRATGVYQTIGTYLGYALLTYRQVYRVEHVLVLGRVMTGPGGDAILGAARAVLEAEPDAAQPAVAFHAASERDKRHGQAVVAAGLPSLT